MCGPVVKKMLEVLVQMVGLIICGIGWRVLKPAGLEPVQTRKVLTSLVILPATASAGAIRALEG